MELAARGKVRDIYALGDNLLFIATDRISAFDVILGSGIPDKGRILTQLSIFWFEFFAGHIETHLLTADVNEYPEPARQYADQLEGRSMLVRRAKPLPVECVVRGYLAGSGWKDYQRSGEICGIKLAEGLRESERFPEPIFTPATKAETGHDENISFDRMAEIVGGDRAEELRRVSIDIYRRANDFARTRGLLLADTKFEFGVTDSDGGESLILIDEVLTPDSSRFWDSDVYEPGKPQPSYDKQFVRDYLEMTGWDKKPPGPVLPDDIVTATTERYREASRLLTGEKLAA